METNNGDRRFDSPFEGFPHELLMLFGTMRALYGSEPLNECPYREAREAVERDMAYMYGEIGTSNQIELQQWLECGPSQAVSCGQDDHEAQEDDLLSPEEQRRRENLRIRNEAIERRIFTWLKERYEAGVISDFPAESDNEALQTQLRQARQRFNQGVPFLRLQPDNEPPGIN